MLRAMPEPVARIEIESVRPDVVSGRWHVSWRLFNDGPLPLALHDAWVPHGRFRGEGHVTLALTVAPGDSTTLELKVATDEAPGTVVENAYLILRSDAFRLFVRMRVTFDDQQTPQPVVETVSAQSLMAPPG